MTKGFYQLGGKRAVAVLLALFMVTSPVFSASPTGFVDDDKLKLSTRIDNYDLHIVELGAEKERLEGQIGKYNSELSGIKKEAKRLNSFFLRQIYTVLLSFGIEVTSTLTLNPLEISLNTALEVTDFQTAVSGWSSKTGAERAKLTEKRRDALEKKVPVYEEKINQTKKKLSETQAQLDKANKKTLDLRKQYFDATKTPYVPGVEQVKKLKEKLAKVQEVLKQEDVIIKDPTTGYGSAKEAVESVYANIKLQKHSVLNGTTAVLPKTGWSGLKNVATSKGGHTKWMGTYRSPEFSPKYRDAWFSKAVIGGAIDFYIEAVPYKENGETRYMAVYLQSLSPNDPFATSSHSVKYYGKVARGQTISLQNKVADPQLKLHNVYWYAYGIKGDKSVNTYIGTGTSVTTTVPVTLYGFDELRGFESVVIDRFMGYSGASVQYGLKSVVNRSYSGVGLSQMHMAIPDQPLLLQGELGLPEYGDAKLIVDYAGEKTTFDCVPTKNGAYVSAIINAKAGVDTYRAKVEVYAGGALIGEVDWEPFTITFDDRYLSGGELSVLQGEIGAIRSALSQLSPKIERLKRTGYASLVKNVAMNASYGTVITNHLKGTKDPNFQYTVQDAMTIDKALVEYLDGLLKETGKGEQQLVSSLKQMKYKGYPEGLAFIDVYYLHLKATALNRPAIELLMTDREYVIDQLSKLQNQTQLLLGTYQSSDANSLVQALSQDVQKSINQISDGGYSGEIVQSALDETQMVLTYLEGTYPEFKGYLAKYQSAGTKESGIRIFINGQRQGFSGVSVVSHLGQTYVSINFFGEAFGAKVELKDKDKVVVNGATVVLATLPTSINGQTYLPLKPIAEKLGYRSEYQKDQNILNFNK